MQGRRRNLQQASAHTEKKQTVELSDVKAAVKPETTAAALCWVCELVFVMLLLLVTVEMCALRDLAACQVFDLQPVHTEKMSHTYTQAYCDRMCPGLHFYLLSSVYGHLALFSLKTLRTIIFYSDLVK